MPKFVFETTGGPWVKDGLRGKIVERSFGTEAESIEAFAAARGIVASAVPSHDAIRAAEAHISSFFTAFGLLEGLKKLTAAQAAGTLASIPKTVAVAEWVETVKALALAGDTNFPPAPHSFEEVISE